MKATSKEIYSVSKKQEQVDTKQEMFYVLNIYSVNIFSLRKHFVRAGKLQCYSLELTHSVCFVVDKNILNREIMKN